jgi:hypothetical protein
MPDSGVQNWLYEWWPWLYPVTLHVLAQDWIYFIGMVMLVGFTVPTLFVLARRFFYRISGTDRDSVEFRRYHERLRERGC